MTDTGRMTGRIALLAAVALAAAGGSREIATAPGAAAVTPPALPAATDEILTIGDLEVSATHALTKVRPADPVTGSSEVRMHAARNEFEPFQLLLRSSRPLAISDVVVSDLEGPGGAIPSRWATVYRVDLLDLTTPSSETGGTGEWPDPLVPRVDRYFGEPRSAFPLELDVDRTRAVWVELYVPPATPPGTYRGTTTIRAAGLDPIRIPVTLEVWPFTLPSTSSLPTSFGISGLSVLDAHHGDYTDDADLYELTRLYVESALMHRISTHGGTMVPPRGQRRGSRWALYWGDLDGEIGPFLDGTVFDENDPLPGARATSAMVRTPQNLEGEDRAAYWRSWTDHFEERGWLDRLFLYLWDEPTGPWKRTPIPSLDHAIATLLGEPVHEYAELAALAAAAKEAAPELTTAVTEQRIPGLDDSIDRWIPLVNCLEMKPGYPSYCESTPSREAYDSPDPERRPWFYQSCGSHGCDEVGGPYYSDWPSYMIDAGAVDNRIMQWLAWRYRMGGELYHNTTRAYSVVSDPWESVYAHGGNGDGTFFYPGLPERIGGTRHIPIESIRLKLLREGLEDYEYLALLAESGERARADRIAARLAPAAYRWEADPDQMLQSRLELGEILARLARESS